MKLSVDEYQRVLLFFKKAVQDEPEKWSYWGDIGFCHGKLGQWQEAVTAFGKIVDQHEVSATVLNMLGHAYLKLENYSEAARILERAQRVSPTNLSILYKLAVVHYNQGDSERALSLMQQIVKQKPRHSKTQFNLGLIYHRLHDQVALDRQIAIVHELNPALAERLARIQAGGLG